MLAVIPGPRRVAFASADDGSILFRDHRESLWSLLFLLHDGVAARDEVLATLERFPLWRIVSRMEGPDNQKLGYAHDFEFGTPHRLSSRVYRVTFRTRFSAETLQYELAPELTSRGFGSQARLPPSPCIRDAATFDAALRVLSDRDVGSFIRETFWENPESRLVEVFVEGSSSRISEVSAGADDHVVGLYWNGLRDDPVHWKAEWRCSRASPEEPYQVVEWKP